jgi:regulatory protein
MAREVPALRSGTITALRIQERDPQRVNMFLDDEFAIGLSLDTLVRERLYVGQTLTQSEFARLVGAEQADKAYHAALRAIEQRPRSAAEINERLRRKGYAAEDIAAAIERLHTLGLVDDAAFARFWIDGRQRQRPRGPAALRAELRRKGVDPATIAAAIDNSGAVESQEEQARSVARGALRRYADSADYAAFSRRLGGLLQRRGFGHEVVRMVVAELWSELRNDAPPDDPE